MTLAPTTGPRSSSTGAARPVRLATNFASALVGDTGAVDGARVRIGIDPCDDGRTDRRRPTADPRSCDRRLVRRRLRGLGDDRLGRDGRLGRVRRLRRVAGLGSRLRLPALALHVHAAAEVRALGDGDRGETMSPSTEPPSRMSTFSDAVTLPLTSPSTMTALANTCALILPFGPIVSTWSFSSILPSTWPSMVRSSLPFSSPLMTTDLPMFTRSLSIRRLSACGAADALGWHGWIDRRRGWSAGWSVSPLRHASTCRVLRLGRGPVNRVRDARHVGPVSGSGGLPGGESPQSISAVRNSCLVTPRAQARRSSAQRCYAIQPGLLRSVTMTRIYLDHNATTPLARAVRGRAWRRCCGRSSATRRASTISGSGPRRSSTRPGSAVAELIGADPSEVVFTSGGTESDNFAIRGAAEALEPTGRRHLVASAIEHEAVLNTLKALARRGWETTLLPVGESGIVDRRGAPRGPDGDQTAVVSVMHANNEIGHHPAGGRAGRGSPRRAAPSSTPTPCSRPARSRSTSRRSASTCCRISAHKFYGPKGVGALWIRRGVRLVAAMTGGKQERGRRAGTENVAGIVGMGVAARLARGQDGRRGGAPGGAARSARGGHPARRCSGTAINGDRDRARAQHDATSASTASRPSRCSSRSTSRASPCPPARRARRARSSRRTC